MLLPISRLNCEKACFRKLEESFCNFWLLIKCKLAADNTKFCPHQVLFVYNYGVCYTRHFNYSIVIRSIITVFLYLVHSLLLYQKAICLKYSCELEKKNLRKFIEYLLEDKCIEIKQNSLMTAAWTTYLELAWHIWIIVMHFVWLGAEAVLQFLYKKCAFILRCQHMYWIDSIDVGLFHWALCPSKSKSF